MWCLVYSLPENIPTLKASQRAAVCDYSPRSNVLAVSVSWLASVLWQLGAIRGNDRLIVLTLRSNYLFSWEWFWWMNGSPRQLLCASPWWWLFVCSQVPQEPGHLPGVQGQHKDQLCHQLSGDQRGDFSLTLYSSGPPGLFLYVTRWIHADITHTSVCICSGETLSRVLNV